MNHCVPDFDMDDDHLIATSSTVTRDKSEDEIMELFWQDGQVVAHSRNQRKSPPPPLPQAENTHHLHLTEDEMATWLHYPLEDLYSDDLLYPNPTTSPLPPVQPRSSASSALCSPDIRPPPPAKPPVPPSRNFQMFSRMRGNLLEPSIFKPDLTVVDSSATPPTTNVSAAPVAVGGERLSRGGGSGDMTVTSSSGSGTDTAAAAAATTTAAAAGEKRKARDVDETAADTAAAAATDYHTQDTELESAEEKKHSRGSHPTKRSRAAEVHNLSERRRRDRINEKMRALQELIPRCNKSDKASMLDEAIEYLKSLQMQVQMMSMGCGMVPMMYPGMQQQYMPPMGMGMSMGMGMDMGMNRPVMPLPSAVPGSAIPMAPAAAAGPQLAPRFTIPPFPMPSVLAPDAPGNQSSNQADSSHSSIPIQSSGMAQLPNLGDPYQQYMALQQMQMQMQMQMQAAQNQSSSLPGSSKPSTSKSEVEDHKDNQ